MPPRILFVDQSGAIGGAELSLRDIARHFRSTSTVALLEDGPFAEVLRRAGVTTEVVVAAAGLHGVRREGGLVSGIAALPALTGVVLDLVRRARRHELIYANTQKAFVASALAALIARRPLVWHLRDILSAEHFSAGNIALVTRLTRFTRARVIANSAATAQAFTDAGGDRRRLVTIVNGIDPAPWTELPADTRVRLRAELEVGKAPLVGLFGRLAAWKGQHVLVEAVASLPEAQAVLVGEPLFGEDDYAATLKAQVARLGLDGRVKLLGYRPDVPALMRACDVVVHASTAPEPFGRVIVEAMLAGTPVIASDAGGAREIVEPGRSGLLVPQGDAAALTAALGGLLADPARAAGLAEAGQRRAQELYGLDTMLRRIEQVVGEMASRR